MKEDKRERILELESMITSPDFKPDSFLEIVKELNSLYHLSKIAINYDQDSYCSQLIEDDFNPAVDGIIVLAQDSLGRVDGITKLVSHFKSNKYDLKFINALVNITEIDGVYFEEVVLHLIQHGDLDEHSFLRAMDYVSSSPNYLSVQDRLGLIDDNSCPEFIERILTKTDFFTRELDRGYLGRSGLLGILKLLLFVKKKGIIERLEPSFLLEMTYRVIDIDEISDEDSVFLLTLGLSVSDQSKGRFSRGEIHWKDCYLELYNEHHENNIFNKVIGLPLHLCKSSSKLDQYLSENKYYSKGMILNCFSEDLEALESLSSSHVEVMLKHLSNRESSGKLSSNIKKIPEESLKAIISKASSETILALIKKISKEKDAVVLIERNSSPALSAVLKKKYPLEFGLEGRTTKKKGMTDVEIFNGMYDAIRNSKVEEFEELSSKAKDGDGTGLFSSKILQRSYYKSYDNLRIDEVRFLSKLKSKEDFYFFVENLQSKIYAYGKYSEGQGKLKFKITQKEIYYLFEEGNISLDLATINSDNKVDLLLSKEEIYYLDSLTDLLSFNEIVELISRSNEKGMSPSVNARSLDSEELQKISLEFSKDDFLKATDLSPIESLYSILKYKDNYEFSESEILEFISTGRRQHSPSSVIRAVALNKYLNPLSVKMCSAILDSKADNFKKIFPHASNRDHRLRHEAKDILSEIEKESGDLATNLDKPKVSQIKEMLSTTRQISKLIKIIGEDWLSVLLTNKSRNTKLSINNISLLDKDSLAKLASKYKLDFSPLSLGETVEKELLLSISDLLKEKIRVRTTRGNIISLLELKCNLIPIMRDHFDVIREIIEAKKYDLIDIEEFGEELLFALTPTNILELIEAGIEIHKAKGLSYWIIENRSDHLLNELIKLNFHIEEYDVVSRDRPLSLSDITVFEKLDILGIPFSTYGESESASKKIRKAIEAIFDSEGNIKEDFVSSDLSNLSKKVRLDILNHLIAQDQAYSILLKENIEGRFIVFNKDTFKKHSFEAKNLSNYFGFGAPQMTKEELVDFNGLINHKKSDVFRNFEFLERIFPALSNFKVAFDDLFIKSESGLFEVVYYDVENAIEFDYSGLRVLLKDLNKKELRGLLSEASLLRDTVETINSTLRVFPKGEISDLLEIIKGVSVGEEFSFEGLVESEVYNSVKWFVVSVSKSRKHEDFLHRIHDLAGTFKSRVNALFRDEELSIKLNREMPHSDLNNIFKDKENHITNDSTGGRYYIYIAETHRQVREIGDYNKWCTSYTDSYTESAISGTHFLFCLNRVEDDEIEFQVYVRNSPLRIDQLQGYSNDRNLEKSSRSCFRDEEIIEVLQNVMGKKRKKSSIAS